MQCPYYNFELNRLVNKLTDNIGVGFELETLVRGKSNILIDLKCAAEESNTYSCCLHYV